MLKKRILTVLILLPIFLAALFLLPDRGWAGFILIGILIALNEWAKIANFSKSARLSYIGISLILIVLLMWAHFKLNILVLISPYFYLGAVLFWVVVVPFWMRLKWRAIPLVYAFVGWIILLPTWLAFIELRERGPFFLLSLLSIVWIADSAAYFFGRQFGKHKLAPIISPNKTWEGLLGAFIAITIYGFVLIYSNFDLGLNAIVLIVVMLWVLTGLSVIGDLFESMIKRQYGVKDSGNFLPGHGGMLDRIDSLTATMPIAALCIMLLKV